MQIRSLQWRGIPMWPPEWDISHEGDGEDGVLEDVQLRNYQSTCLISVVAKHLNDIRYGIIMIEDFNLLEILFHKLKENTGRPLTEIGSLEINLLPLLQMRGPKQVRPVLMFPNIKKVATKKN